MEVSDMFLQTLTTLMEKEVETRSQNKKEELERLNRSTDQSAATSHGAKSLAHSAKRMEMAEQEQQYQQWQYVNSHEGAGGGGSGDYYNFAGSRDDLSWL